MYIYIYTYTCIQNVRYIHIHVGVEVLQNLRNSEEGTSELLCTFYLGRGGAPKISGHLGGVPHKKYYSI